VQARVPPFAGAAVGYFNDNDLHAVAAAIAAYPLRERRASGLTSGPGDQGTAGLEVA
jgi:hypothetical protein